MIICPTIIIKTAWFIPVPTTTKPCTAGGRGFPRESSDESPFMKGNCPTKEEIKEFLNIMRVRRRKHFIVKSPESLSLKIYAGKVTGVPAGANSDPP